MNIKEEIQKELSEPTHGHPTRETEQRVRRLEKLIVRVADEFNVSKRSELLRFMDWHYEKDIADTKTKEAIIDTYLKQL